MVELHHKVRELNAAVSTGCGLRLADYPAVSSTKILVGVNVAVFIRKIVRLLLFLGVPTAHLRIIAENLVRDRGFEPLLNRPKRLVLPLNTSP